MLLFFGRFALGLLLLHITCYFTCERLSKLNQSIVDTRKLATSIEILEINDMRIGAALHEHDVQKTNLIMDQSMAVNLCYANSKPMHSKSPVKE